LIELQAFGTRTIRVAAGWEWNRVADAGTTVDVMRGHRLEKASAQLRSADGDLK